MKGAELLLVRHNSTHRSVAVYRIVERKTYLHQRGSTGQIIMRRPTSLILLLFVSLLGLANATIDVEERKRAQRLRRRNQKQRRQRRRNRFWFPGIHDHNHDHDNGPDGNNNNNNNNNNNDDKRDDGKNKDKGKSAKKGKDGKNGKGKGSGDNGDDADPFISRDPYPNSTDPILPDFIRRPCKYLEEQFNESVICDFDLKIFPEGKVSFNLETTEPYCDDGVGAEQVCFEPVFKGEVDFFNLYTTSTTLFKGVAVGGQAFGDVGITLGLCFTDNEPGSGTRMLESPSENKFTEKKQRKKRKRPQGKIAPPPPTETAPSREADPQREADPKAEGGFGAATLDNLGIFVPNLCNCGVVLFGFDCTCVPCEDGLGIIIDCEPLFPAIEVCQTVSNITSIVGNGNIIQPSVPDFFYDLGIIPNK